MNMKKLLLTLAAVICCATVFTSCKKANPEILNFNPLLQWGCSIADVERHIQGMDWWQDGNDKLEYWEDPFQSWHKWYWVDAENSVTEQYLFETEDGKNLRYVYCACWNNTVSAENSSFASTLLLR